MKQIPVVIFGLGGVGRELVRQIINGRSCVASRNGCQFNVVGLVDSQRWVWQPQGLTDEQLWQVLGDKEQKRPLGQERPSGSHIILQTQSVGLQNVIVVDVTAQDGMEPTLNAALDAGYSIALANKKPFAGPWAIAQRFFNNPCVRHESTVGGGQPVIATLRYLLDTNDPIYQIQGQLSGTIGYICSRLDQGVSFSQAITEAKTNGYTEPDPREDLGGKDVRRKIMILGRMAGWPLEEADIEVESLYTPALAGLSVAAFMAAAHTMDEEMDKRVKTAVSQGKLLRYVAQLENGKGSVGLQAIPAHSPLANLKYISFRTAYYNTDPLLIGGRGAGVDMTAAGVLGDMIGLVREVYK